MLEYTLAMLDIKKDKKGEKEKRGLMESKDEDEKGKKQWEWCNYVGIYLSGQI